jgi:hypothetical protein
MRWFLSFLVFLVLVCSSVFLDCLLSDPGQEESAGDSTQAPFLFHGAEGAGEAGLIRLPRSILDAPRTSWSPDEGNRFPIWSGSEGDLWKGRRDQGMDRSPSSVPIPGTVPLLGTGLAALVIASRRLRGRIRPPFPL